MGAHALAHRDRTARRTPLSGADLPRKRRPTDTLIYYYPCKPRSHRPRQRCGSPDTQRWRPPAARDPAASKGISPAPPDTGAFAPSAGMHPSNSTGRESTQRRGRTRDGTPCNEQPKCGSTRPTRARAGNWTITWRCATTTTSNTPLVNDTGGRSLPSAPNPSISTTPLPARDPHSQFLATAQPCWTALGEQGAAVSRERFSH
jgi:hypothetical protein